ncbi:MAG: hypothetical protein EBZ48_03950 [Proteobacteria bacterium]|nr:hypothetical protein [Pseudomonadota bacterium]
MNKGSRAREWSVGAVIRLKTTWGMPPDGVYRIEAIAGDSLLLSSGEVQCVTALSEVEVVQYGITGPIDWLGEEIQIRERMLAMCACEECRQKVETKKEQLRQRSNQLG